MCVEGGAHCVIVAPSPNRVKKVCIWVWRIFEYSNVTLQFASRTKSSIWIHREATSNQTNAADLIVNRMLCFVNSWMNEKRLLLFCACKSQSNNQGFTQKLVWNNVWPYYPPCQQSSPPFVNNRQHWQWLGHWIWMAGALEPWRHVGALRRFFHPVSSHSGERAEPNLAKQVLPIHIYFKG